MALAFGDYDFDEIVAGFRRVAGAYAVEEPASESADPGIRANDADGVDGVGTVVAGFRGRQVGPFVTTFVAASRETCLSDYEAVRDALEVLQVPDGITIGTSSAAEYENCYLMRGGCRPVDQPRETETGTWWMDVVWVFEQMRPNAEEEEE